MSKPITSHTQLDVYRKAFEVAMSLFEISKTFPKEERYSLTDQMRRCSRSVCANLAEAWRKRRYRAAFICKLNDCEGEAAETQVWLEFSVKCGYVDRNVAAKHYSACDEVLRMLVAMIRRPTPWLLRAT